MNPTISAVIGVLLVVSLVLVIDDLDLGALHFA